MELSLERITKSFGEKNVLKDVSFKVSGGSAFGLLGRNGAGKTTTIRIIVDIFKADGGRVLWNGSPVDYSKIKMGYLPEERGLYPKINVGDQMVYIGRLKGLDPATAKKNASALLEELEASEYWPKKLETLSKGNQQKIQLAIAVLHDPDVVILDEPFSGLDPVNAQMLKNLITKQVKKGKVVLFSSHQMPYVEEFCQHICIYNNGNIAVEGRISDIKKTYLRNRISVSPEKPPKEFLDEAAKDPSWGDIVAEAACKDSEVHITLKSPDDKKILFSFLSGRGFGINSFSVIEPTLEEIFVEKAGGSA